MMGSDFHATIKLITGEEIFALVSVDQTEEDPIIIMQSPVVMKVLSTGKGSMMKIRPWLEVPGDDIYIIKYDISSCGKVTNRLYFESKEESNMNQNMNIEIRFSNDVDNCYRYNNRAKNLN